MMRPILFLAGHEIRYMLKQRETLLWTFVMPVIFMYFFGMISGGPSGSADKPTGIALVNEGGDGGFLVDELVKRLEFENFRVDRNLPKEKWERYRRCLKIPAPTGGHKSFTEALLAGEETVLRFRRTGQGNNRDLDRFRVQKAAYSLVAELASLRRDDPDSAAFAALRQEPRNIRLTVQSAGKRRDVPTGIAQSIPGTMVMFVLMTMLTGGAITLVIEREKGLLRRLASTPMTRGQIVAGKWLGKLFLGLLQLAFAVAVSVLLFDMDWGPHWMVAGIALVSWAMFCTSLGLLLGNLARSEGQMAGLGVISSLLLAALGGCWWPMEITPEWMQALGGSLPTGWAMNSIHLLVSFQEGAVAVMPHLIAMVGSAAVLGLLARRTFRYE